MAGIDKTYIDGKDYKHYRTWWIDNYYKMKRELGYAVWFTKKDKPLTARQTFERLNYLTDYQKTKVEKQLIKFNL